MKTKLSQTLVILFFAAYFIASILGLVNGIEAIARNQYLHHKMFRLAGWNLMEAWTSITIKVVVAALLSILAILFIVFVWKWYLSRLISVVDKDRLVRNFVYLFSFVGFLASFYVANKYYLPYRFAKISLITDFALFCFWSGISLALLKIPWRRFSVLPPITYKLALSLLFLQSALTAAVLIDQKTNPPQKMNVVWILIDALRPDHLGCYDSSKNTSPFIDEFAAKNILFKHAYSQESYTQASVPSFFTSTYPFVHRVLYDNPTIDVLDLSFVTIAEILKEQNYRTAAFVFNPHLKEAFHFGQGFETYDDNKEGLDLSQPYSETYETARKMHEKLKTYLTGVQSRPLFLYLHYRDVHEPYAPPPPYDKGCVAGDSPEAIDAVERREIYLKGEENVYRCLYDGDIRYTDHYLKKTFDLLNKNGINRENTIFIITADHGQEFYEEHLDDKGYQSHGRTLYQEQIHVPLIVAAPRLQNRIIQQQVGLIDLAPTILDLVHVNWKKYHQFQGRSLVALLKTGEGLPSLVLAGGNRNRGILIRNGWKYYRYEKTCKSKRQLCFVRPDKSGFAYGDELYNIDSDPKETINLFATDGKTAGDMQKQLTGFLKTPPSYEAGSQRELDEQTKEELKALGYIN